jgi:cell division transport system permease protein
MNTWIDIRRVMTAGAKSFARGGLVTAATVLVMTVMMGIVSNLIFLSAALGTAVDTIKDKVDVNVYFVTTASESDIQDLVVKVNQLPQVASTTYTNRDEALASFRARHANDQLTLQALDELGENPLDASLAIRAKDPSQYETIVNFLDSTPALAAGGTSIIDRVNYYQNKAVIERLTDTIHTTENTRLTIILFFAIASILITLATLRLAIYSSRDEIAVMRLVGANNMYIRGPFIVAGVLNGVAAALITLIILFPATWYSGGALITGGSLWFMGFNLFSYYVSHFAMIFGILVGSGILLGGLASLLAVRRYLKI